MAYYQQGPPPPAPGVDQNFLWGVFQRYVYILFNFTAIMLRKFPGEVKQWAIIGDCWAWSFDSSVAFSRLIGVVLLPALETDAFIVFFMGVLFWRRMFSSNFCN